MRELEPNEGLSGPRETRQEDEPSGSGPRSLSRDL